MKQIAMCGIIAAILTAGCTRTAPPPVTPSPTLEASLPPLPPPAPTLEPKVVMVQTPEAPTCHEVVVKVGKLDVNMPHGGKLDIAGVKGETTAYHILLEGVEFTQKECQ